VASRRGDWRGIGTGGCCATFYYYFLTNKFSWKLEWTRIKTCFKVSSRWFVYIKFDSFMPKKHANKASAAYFCHNKTISYKHIDCFVNKTCIKFKMQVNCLAFLP